MHKTLNGKKKKPREQKKKTKNSREALEPILSPHYSLEADMMTGIVGNRATSSVQRHLISLSHQF